MKSIMMLSVFTIIVLSQAWPSSAATAKQTTSSDRTIEREIAKTLASNNISGCGEFTWTPNAGQSSEYTVKCSNDGKKWKTYTVWIAIRKIMVGTPN